MFPGQHESAGKRKSGQRREGNKALRRALTEAAHAAARTTKPGRTYLRGQYRRLVVRGGKKKAAVAVGHTILRMAYHLLTHETTYQEQEMVYLDERLYGEDRIKEKLEMSYLGGLSKNKELKANPTSAKGRVRQQLADIYVNLRLAGVLPAKRQDMQGAVLLVTSPQVAEGKTTVAAGLAATMARGGGKVAVIDGNMREPATHLTFAMRMSGPGLSGLLKSSGRETVDDIVQRSNVPGLWLIPVGAAIEDPAFLLEEKFPAILFELRKKVDLVIIDGPALLDGVEAGLMAKMVDGVALVIDYKQDKMKLLLRAKEILVLLAHVPAGVVINRMPRRRSKSYFAVGYSEPTASEELIAKPATDEEEKPEFMTPSAAV